MAEQQRDKGQTVIRNTLYSAIWTIALHATFGGPVAAEPLGHPVVGPKLICFKYSTFSLLAGERITDFSSSPEAMSVKIQGARDSYTIAESEIFKQLKHTEQPLFQHEGMSVYRIRVPWNQGEDHNGIDYGLYGRTRFSIDKDRLLLLLYGPLIRGGASDARIYERLRVRDVASVACQFHFTYSFEDFLPK